MMALRELSLLLLAVPVAAACSQKGGDAGEGTSPANKRGEQRVEEAVEPAADVNPGGALQAVLDHEPLQEYFHADTLPERKPLVILQSEVVAEVPRLEAFGEPVVKASAEELEEQERPFLEVTKLELRGQEALVEIRYPPEGIRGSFTLAYEEGRWQVREGQIVEE